MLSIIANIIQPFAFCASFSATASNTAPANSSALNFGINLFAPTFSTIAVLNTPLNDVCRIIGENTDYFEKVRGDADSLGGLIIETLGRIPKQEKEIIIGHIALKVIAVNKRRIEKINVRKLN